tara:strand:+ start:2499 stop:3458 length:960 start_codon:yes stop_codon:yes gene_type:complete
MYLKISNLEKYYVPNEPIITNLDFSIKKGEIISFIGDSGSGKTTFLKCLAGLEKINSGKIELNKQVLNDRTKFIEPEYRKVGFVFQDYPLFPHLNVLRNITINLNSSFFSKLEQVILLTNLQDLMERFPHQLSGGEQQRVCIARALIREPDLLLLDEPFSNIDANTKSVMKEEIYKIIKNANITTILVTHDVSDTFDISDKILIFKGGKLQQFASPIDIYRYPANYYCGKMLGKFNKLMIEKKPFFIRPEKIKIKPKSKISVTVKKCFFLGKEYFIKADYGGDEWTIYSLSPYNKGDKIYISYEKEDLTYFSPDCLTHF